MKKLIALLALLAGLTPSAANAAGTISGTLSAANPVILLCSQQGDGAATLQLGGTWTGTYTLAASLDQATYTNLTAVSFGTTSAATMNANGLYQAAISGGTCLRLTGASLTGSTPFILTTAPGGIATAPGALGSVTQGGAPWSVSQSGSPWGVSGTVTAAMPYSGTTTLQTLTASSFVGIGAVDANGTFSRFLTSKNYDATNGDNSLPAFMSCDPVASKCAKVTAANALKTDGSAVTQPVSGTVTVTPGAGNFGTSLNQINGAALSIGQNTMANSVPVAIASNQGTLPVNISTACGNPATLTTVNVSGISARTTVITHSGSTSTYICAIHITDILGSTNFGYGTGANCVTTFNSLESQGTNKDIGPAGGAGVPVYAAIAANQDACVNTATATNGFITYVQQ